MKTVIIFMILAFLCSGVSRAETLEEFLTSSDDEVHTAVTGKEFTAKKLTANLAKINELGLVFVQNADSNITLAESAEWNMGLNGSGEVDLNQYLKAGENLVIFVLWNKEGKNLKIPFYKNTSLLDSWSFDYSLVGDGTTLFHEKQQKTGGAGVMYWNAFYVYQNSNGLTIRPTTKAEVRRLNRVMKKTNAARLPEQKNSDVIANIAINLRVVE